MPFKKAIKHNALLRMAIAGIAGSGKTWTGLTIGTALAEGSPLALIDTEHGSASKYADQFQFDVSELSHFHPDNYINAIREAEQAGYAVLIIDSLSHAWNGTGGALELVESIARRVAAQRKKEPNSFNAWGDVTPMQNKLIDTILGSSLHIIATMRSKTEYVVETVGGKSVPRKVGMAPIQRADVEYEFDIYADMDIENRMIIQKSRCGVLSGQVIDKPDASLAGIIQTWLQGEPLPEPTTQQIAMQALLQDFYNLSPATYARIHNWELMALRAGLGIKEGPIPTDYTDEHVENMRAYVTSRKQEKETREARVS
jgi:AAA domain